MFEIQQPIQPGPVNAGIAAQPLVTSAAPVVTPDAVTALTDAFHKGFITSQDIIDRIGQVGQLKNKAAVEQLKEFIDPDAIEARKAEIQAGGAEARLKIGQAQAGQRLLPGAEQVSTQQTNKQLAENLWGANSVDIFNQLKGSFGDTEVPKMPDGSPDFHEMAARGSKYNFIYTRMQQGLVGMTAKSYVDAFDSSGRPTKVPVNAAGQFLSDENGKPTAWYKRYQDMYEDALSKREEISRENQERNAPEPAEAAPVVSPAGADIVAPDNPKNNAMRALAVERLGVEPNQAASMSDRDLDTVAKLVQMRAQNAPMVQVAQPAAPAVTVTPPAVGIPSASMFTKRESPEEVFAATKKDPSVTSWTDKLPAIVTFNNIVDRYKEIDKKKEVSTQADINLANEVAQMASLAKTGRGIDEAMRAKNIEEAVPLLERVANIKGLVLKQHAFPEQVRERLIEEGRAISKGWEQPAAAALRTSVQRGVPSDWFHSYEQDLLRKYPTDQTSNTESVTPKGPETTVSKTGTSRVSLPSGVQLVF